MVDAVLCNSDNDAALLIRKAISSGLAIPHQIAIAGFDDQPLVRLLTEPLTTVSQPVQALAIRLISMHRDRMEYPDLLPTTL